MITEFLTCRPFLSNIIYKIGMAEFKDDILQDVAMRIWCGSEFRGTSGQQFRTWVKIITRNRIWEMKRRGKDNRIFVDVMDMEAILASKDMNVEQAIWLREELNRVRRLAKDLPSFYKLAVVSYLDNWGEITLPEGWSEGAGKSRRHRGFKAILKQMARENLNKGRIE